MKQQLINKIAEAFNAHNKQFYLVGGTVRDALLNRESKDTDAATNAKPEEIKAILAETTPLHIIPIGEKFGTIQAIYADNEIIEVTTYRGERYNPGSRKPEVQFGDSLLEDLRRRDFTINAIAKDPLTGKCIDPFHGLRDIQQSAIVAVDDAKQRFIDDPLRMLRAVRLAAQLSFAIATDTYAEILKQTPHILDISQERTRDEINKILMFDDARCIHGLYTLHRIGLMQYVLPEVEELIGVNQYPHHTQDVFGHTALVVKLTSARLEVRWSALLHDIAKPQTRSVDDKGITHFYEHEDIGTEMARQILTRLRFGNDFIAHVAKIVHLHMRVNAYTESWSNSAVRRLFADSSDVLEDLLDLAIADGSSDRHEPPEAVKARIDHLRDRMMQVSEHVKEQPLQSPLNGNELMQIFDRTPGPWLSPVKQHLQDLVIEGALESNDKQSAIEAAKLFLGESDDE